MRKIMALAGVVGVMALAGLLCAQGDAPGATGGGQRVRGGGDGMKQEGRGPRPEGGPMQMMDMMMMHATSPAAVDNAEAQQLLDKVIAARKQVMKSEQDRLAAFEKVVATARAGNKEATEEARKALRETSEKLRGDVEAMGEAVRALGEKMRSLRPEGPGGMKGDQPQGERPQGERQRGAGKGEGHRQPPAKKDGM